MNTKILAELTAIAGPERVTDAIEERLCCSYDGGGRECLPAAVVHPADTEEVCRIMALLHRHGVPVVVRGGGSGMTGGAVPVEGCVVLAMAGMNRIVEIDTVNQLAVVEPGVITGDLQAEAARHGLMYPPDPASAAFCTIGGNVAECAGGPRAVKYGVTRDYVKGLDVVLADGRLIRTGGRTDKGVAGYDLTRLFVGSEGTLGVITGMTVKLVPRPRARATFLVGAADVGVAAGLVAEILADFTPCTMELMDETAIDLVRGRLPFSLGAAVRALLLIELDGGEAAVRAEGAALADFLQGRPGVLTVRRAADGRRRDELWAARRTLSPAAFDLRPHKLSEDVVVPRSRVAALACFLRDLAASQGLTIFSFGHAGDGNMHVNIMLDRADSAEVERAREARRRLFARVIELGGTITGEHGVGLSKAEFLADDVGAAALDVMRRLKRCLDPKGILNPGKIFPDAIS